MIRRNLLFVGLVMLLTTCSNSSDVDYNGHWHIYEYPNVTGGYNITEISYDITNDTIIQKLYRYRFRGNIGRILTGKDSLLLPSGHSYVTYKIDVINDDLIKLTNSIDTLYAHRVINVDSTHIASDYLHFVDCEVRYTNEDQGYNIDDWVDERFLIDLVTYSCNDNEVETYLNQRPIDINDYEEFALGKARFMVKYPESLRHKVRISHLISANIINEKYLDTLYTRLRQVGFDTVYRMSLRIRDSISTTYERVYLAPSSVMLPIDNSYDEYYCNSEIYEQLNWTNGKITVLQIGKLLAAIGINCLDEFMDKSVASRYKLLFEKYPDEVFGILAKNESLDIYAVIKYMNRLNLSDSVRKVYRSKAQKGFLDHYPVIGADVCLFDSLD